MLVLLNNGTDFNRQGADLYKKHNFAPQTDSKMRLRIHKEGQLLLAVLAIIVVIISGLTWNFASGWFWPVLVVLLGLYGLILQFFRNPVREIAVKDDRTVYAPADGRVCVIEEVEETEYFKAPRLQVSIFMSPLNVHVNRNPISGIVRYFRYHPGKYLVAWHPKSSTENERTTVVYQSGKTEILMRQIAGALAKRIKYYIGEGDQITQGADMGFIKFGSRVDLYLPLDAKIEVTMDQQVKGNQTVIARL